jgi:hypothetical protein
MTDYAAVLTARYDAQWTLSGDSYEGLTWLSADSPKPSQSELDSLWAEVQYEREYARVESQRRARYVAETDGMFFSAQRDGGDLTGWTAAVDAIKADLPYPVAP